MTGSSRIHSPWFIALLCLALVVVRANGAHLHLCFDGTEPPVSLHMADAGQHHENSGTGETHQDADVPVAGDALAKIFKLKLGDLPLILLAAAILLSLLLSPDRPIALRRIGIAPLTLRGLRPPLRGPPHAPA